MVKRVVLMVLMALGFAIVPQKVSAIDPIPECWPCPWVR